MFQRYAGASTFCGVAGAGKRAQCHAMEAVPEGNDQFAARHLARQLDRGFDGIGARRSGEHHAIIELARFQDQRFECLQEIRLCISMEIKGMSDAIVCDIISQRCLRSEEHTSELQSLMRISYAALRLKTKTSNKC